MCREAKAQMGNITNQFQVVMSDLVKLRRQSALELQAQLAEANQATENAVMALARKQKELDLFRVMYQSSLVQGQ
jgi:hypothetical protein